MMRLVCQSAVGLVLLSSSAPQMTRADVAAESIVLKDHSQKCLDLREGDTTNGKTLQIWDCNGMHTQGWVFKGNRLVYKANQSKCVDLHAGKAENGQKIQIWDCVGEWNTQAPNQEWGYESGELGIYHKASDGKKCIDVPLADMRNGVEVQLWDCDGSEGQLWAFGGEDIEESTTGYVIAIVLLAISLCVSCMVNLWCCYMRRKYRPADQVQLKGAPADTNIMGKAEALDGNTAI